MRVAFYSTQPFDRRSFTPPLIGDHDVHFIDEVLSPATAAEASNCQAACVSSSDPVDAAALKTFNRLGIKLIVVRSSGFDNVDFQAAKRYNIAVRWLPGYAPRAIAEHATALLLALNRKIPAAVDRVRQGDFRIEGLVGFNLYGKTAGIIGMGRIGHAFASIMKGFGMKILATDLEVNPDFASEGITYVSLDELLARADVVSLHCALYDDNSLIINNKTLARMRPEAVLINTARGALVDVQAVLQALDENRLGGYAADVYAGESGIFGHQFPTLQEAGDPLLEQLVMHPKVLLTAHQAYLTREAMHQRDRTVINELTYFEQSSGQDRLMV